MDLHPCFGDDLISCLLVGFLGLELEIVAKEPWERCVSGAELLQGSDCGFALRGLVLTIAAEKFKDFFHEKLIIPSE